MKRFVGLEPEEWEALIGCHPKHEEMALCWACNIIDKIEKRLGMMPPKGASRE